MDKSKAKALKVGAGVIAGIAGAIAAGYIAYEKTKPQQKQAKAWVAKARVEAAKQMKVLKSVSKADYERMMEKALKHYAAIQKVGVSELGSAIKDAKLEWKNIQAQGKEAVKKVVAKKPAAKKAPAKKKAVAKKA